MIKQEMVKEVIEKALLLYREKNGCGLPAGHGDYAWETEFVLDGAKIVLSEGTWYQPALARYKGSLGMWEACLKGSGEFFTACTEVRNLPYGPRARVVSPEFEGYERLIRYHFIQNKMRVLCAPQRKNGYELIKELEAFNGGYEAAQLNVLTTLRDRFANTLNTDIIYPSMIGLAIKKEDGKLYQCELREPFEYSWGIAAIINGVCLSAPGLEQGISHFGENYWNDRFIGCEENTRKMLLLCMAMAVFDVQPFVERYEQIHRPMVPQYMRSTSNAWGTSAAQLLGDIWRRMLYDFARMRLPTKSWYEL
jgi:hypothetical protein